MSSIDHIILFVILFSVFYWITEIRQYSINKWYWYYLTFPLLFYSVVLGCRYGWGDDYLWYKYRFEHPYAYREEDIGFRYLNMIIKNIGFNYIGAYIVYSFIYILGAFFLLKTYRKNKYMLALFLPATILFSTTCIRQAVAHSFVFLALMFLNSGKKWWAGIILMLPCIYFIHASALITLAICIGCYLGWNRILPVKYLLISYILVAVFSFSLAEILAMKFPEWIKYLPSLGTKFISYQENSDKWFGIESIQKERYQSLFALILTTAYYCGFMYLTSLSLKYRYNMKVAYMFNSTILGVFLMRIFMLAEIWRRIVEPVCCMIFIPMGYAFYVYYKNKQRIPYAEKIYANISVCCILLYMILYYGRFIFLYKQSGFFWNN